MTGLDDAIAGLGDGGAATALLVAFLLGLRHATDPDHITAVSVLSMAERPGGMRRTSLLGASWGAGHAATLVGLGLPLVLFGHGLPRGVEQAAELFVGAVIVALAVRLLVRWRRGYLHAHPHSHGTVRHSHPHAHERAGRHPREHEHPHGEALGRSPAAAFGIGLLHGAGGSAPVALVLVGTAPGRGQAAALLALFAAASAASMAGLSAGLGYALSRPAARRAQAVAVPLLGAGSLLFGIGYGLGAV
jgi:ABC-type nickel/cobalt efflux system permease component RcnA